PMNEQNYAPNYNQGYAQPQQNYAPNYNQGYAQPQQNYAPNYNQGYAQPQQNYAPNYNQGYAQPQQNYAPNYNQGYAQQPQQGYAPNYNQGYDPNAQQNYAPNYNQGYDPNAQQNYAPNYNQGYDPNAQQNYAQGYDQSYDPNAQQNYAQGYDQSYDPNAQQAYDPNAQAAYGAYAEQPVVEEENNDGKKKKKKSVAKKIVTAIIILAVLAALVVAGILIYNKFIKDDYADVNLFNEGLVCVCVDDKYGYMDKKGNIKIDCEYDIAYNFSSAGLALVGKYDEDEGAMLYGYINTKGEEVTDIEFYEAHSFGECGVAAVANEDDEWGLINKKGEFVVDYEYVGIVVYDSGVILAGDEEDEVFIINKKGKKVSSTYEYMEWYEDAGIGVYYEESDDDDEGGKFGLIDAKGKEITGADFDGIYEFSKAGIATFVKIVEFEDDEVITCPRCGFEGEYNDYSEEHGELYCSNCYSAVNREYGVINSKGKVVIEAGEYDELYVMANGYILAWEKVDEDEESEDESETYLVLDSKGKVKFEVDTEDWELCGEFADNGLALIEQYDEDEDEAFYGYVNEKGEIVIKCKYENAYGFSDCGIARVSETNDEGEVTFSYIDKNGKEICGGYIYATDFYSDGYAIVAELENDEAVLKVIDKKGKTVCQIEDIDDVILPVYGTYSTGESLMQKASSYIGAYEKPSSDPQRAGEALRENEYHVEVTDPSEYADTLGITGCQSIIQAYKDSDYVAIMYFDTKENAKNARENAGSEYKISGKMLYTGTVQGIKDAQ
ncbi:MAG: hypothetical protein E7667_04200, partial [Ruminococcaceae bacterium]|nr:hypothetical protein [Oscillospiraceae bacterium]